MHVYHQLKMGSASSDDGAMPYWLNPFFIKNIANQYGGDKTNNFWQNFS